MFKAFKKVFQKKAYWIISSSIAFLMLAFSIYLPNFKLIGSVAFSDTVGLGHKLYFLVSLLEGFYTNNTILSAFILASVALFLGINISMLVYIMKANKKAVRKRENAATIGGVLGGVLGIGCAACGSLVLTPLLLLLGAGGILSLLPLHGGEFGLIGILLLLISIVMLAKKINDPLVCPVE